LHLLKGAHYILHSPQQVIARSEVTKQSQSEIATPFRLAMTPFFMATNVTYYMLSVITT